MFIFSKGKPTTSNLIRDKPNKYAGEKYWGKLTSWNHNNNTDIKTSHNSNATISTFGIRNNIWEFGTSNFKKNNESFINKHPAKFPEILVQDHLKTWTLEGDVVLDPFAGSGTTLKVAGVMNRSFIGVEQDVTYSEMIKKRLDMYNIKYDSF